MRFVFMIWICFYSYSSATFNLTGVPKQVILGDNSSVNLECKITSVTNGTQLQWRHQRESNIPFDTLTLIYGIYTNKSCILVNQEFTATYLCDPIAGRYNLIIPSASIINGIQKYKWACGPLFGSQSNIFQLSLLVPVTMVTIEPSTVNNFINVVKGETQNITCTTNSGRPSAWIQWYIGGTNLTSDAQPQPPKKEGDMFISSSALIYTGQEMDHNKTILCEAINIEGQRKAQSTAKYLDIKLPVTNVLIHPITDNKIITIVEGGNRTFTCTTDFCRPAALIQWYVAGQNMTEEAEPQTPEYNSDQVKSSSKLIYTGNDDDHNKTVICEASNIEGRNKVQSIQQVIHIQIAVTKVTITPEGDNNFIKVVLGNKQNYTCTTDSGRPAALIQWYIGDQNVTSGAKLQTLRQNGDKFISISVLTLVGMEENHNKTILCEAANIEGIRKVKSVEKIIFIQLPLTHVTIKPTGYNNVIDVVKGSQLTFICTTSKSRPAAWIQWYIDGTNVTSTAEPQTPEKTGDKVISSSKLLYTGIEANHNKTIHCEASNIEGLDKEKSMDKSIYIQVPVTAILFQPSGVDNVVYVEEGRTTNFTCITNPIRPRAWIQWYIGGKNVTNEAITKSIHNTGQNENTLNSSSLIVYNATDNDHNKTVYCEAVNIDGRMKIKSEEKNLYIQYGPKELSVIPATKEYIVTEKERINLIQCSAKCRPPCTYSWTGTDEIGNLKPYLNFSSIYRNQSGEYNCSARNDFGNTFSFDIKITVLYAPTVLDLIALTGNVLAEHQSVTLQCNIDSYPLSDVTWLFSRTYTKLKNDFDVQQSNYTVKEADCLQTGIYQCNASNVIGNYLQDVELFVNCSTRIDHREHDVPPVFGINDADLLNITVYLIAYPPPSIYWIFTDKNRQNTTINSTENFNVFEHQSNIMNLKVDEDDFGVYTIYASNNIGKEYTYSINVIPQKKPNRPSNVSVECEIYSMTVFWKSEFDGGDTQKFMVTWFDNNRNIIQYSDYIIDEGLDKYHMITSMSLRPDTLYIIFVNSTNKHGTVISVDHVNCSTKTEPTKADQSATAPVIGGIAGSLCGISIAAAVMMYWKRRKNTNEDKEPIERSKKKTSEEEDDELVDNPLYVTSGAENGAVYSTVDKTKKKVLEDTSNFRVGDQGPVYSEVKKGGKNAIPVDKHDGKGKQRGKKGEKEKHNRDIEMGNVYSNTKGILHDDNDEEVYANAESKSKSKKSIGKMYIPRKNKDGLIYADLDLDPSTSGKKFVIRGLENRTNYAIIDLNIKVDPLPSDDEDDGDEDKKTDHKDGFE